MDKNQIGTVTEAMVLAALLKAGKTVLSAFGGKQRYDLVIDEAGIFQRIQCKTGRLRDGSVIFYAKSKSYRGKNVPYTGQVEYFGVFCPETGQSYLVPSNLVRTGCNLRVEPVGKNCAHMVSHWAKDFEL